MAAKRKRARAKKPVKIPPQRTGPPLAEVLLKLHRDSGALDRSFLRTLIHSINEGWYTFSPEDRTTFVQTVRNLVNHRDPKIRAAGLKAAVAFENMNLRQLDLVMRVLDDEPAKEPQQHVHIHTRPDADERGTRLAALSGRLGIGTVVDETRPDAPGESV